METPLTIFLEIGLSMQMGLESKVPSVLFLVAFLKKLLTRPTFFQKCDFYMFF